MIALMLESPWGLIGFLTVLGMLLFAACAVAHQDGFLSGQRVAERRNRQQMKYDYERGVVEGQRRTLLHLRDTGVLGEFREPPASFTDRPL